MKSWYTIKNKSATTGSISIHDEIGFWGVTAKQFIDDVKALGEVTTINLSVHSPGGSVFDGLAIYNSLAYHPAKIYGRVEGIAASAASFILMAADDIAMPEDSFLMIHNTMGGAFGDAEDLRDMAALMDKLQVQIANIYQKRTKLPEQDILDMMAAETWMTAAEAHAKGFADQVTDSLGIAAKAGEFNKYFKEPPMKAAPDAIDGIKTERDLENFLRDAGGLSRTQATGIVAKAKAIIQREAGDDGRQQQLALLAARLGKVSIPKSLTS
jgi:ATP-dependent Clp protease protease subunit